MNRGLRDISTNCNGEPCLNPNSLSKDIYETIEEMWTLNIWYYGLIFLDVKMVLCLLKRCFTLFYIWVGVHVRMYTQTHPTPAG